MKKWIGAIVLLIVICVAVPAMAVDVQMNGNVLVNGGGVTANLFTGDGSSLTNLPGGNIAAGSVITAGTVNTTSIANYAITPGKIGFYQNHVAIVATSGGDYTDPSTAMTNYSAWCPAPSATHPCLLKIMPGVYTVGSSVVMQAYIDIEGSGEKTTKITSALSSSAWPPDTATLTGASNAELRFLTVENTGAGSYTTAILNTSQSPSMLHVTATASGGTGGNYGVYNYASSPTMTNVTATVSGGTGGNYGVYNYFISSPAMTNMTATASGGTSSYGVFNYSTSSPAMTNVTATASGGTSNNIGVSNNTSSPTMTNVTATASGGADNIGVSNSTSSPTMTNVTASGSGGGTYNYGVYNDTSGTVTINNSVIKGTTNSIDNGAGVTTLVGNTKLDGVTSNAGTLTCAGVYNATYAFYPSTCP